MQMKVFNKGQVVIPAWLRKRYNINIGDFIDVVPEEGDIRLIPIKKERLNDKLFGVFAKYKEQRAELTPKEIEKATEIGFSENWRGKDEVD
ncbi:AbrB/MazE/SpoVT family DNA-binding domain-containing protein [bacterium]|nr:AbrB/MazE/SpoVT family DNA-binding domain-containing protein [bacterium]MBU1599432.1 AbrB/MazE/SpoVT family DNA-binding domain-containing protein [bacterium]